MYRRILPLLVLFAPLLIAPTSSVAQSDQAVFDLCLDAVRTEYANQMGRGRPNLQSFHGVGVKQLQFRARIRGGYTQTICKVRRGELVDLQTVAIVRDPGAEIVRTANNK